MFRSGEKIPKALILWCEIVKAIIQAAEKDIPSELADRVRLISFDFLYSDASGEECPRFTSSAGSSRIDITARFCVGIWR
jgi:hypothetical protein